MLYSEFLKGTRAPETPDTYDQFQIIGQIYEDCKGHIARNDLDKAVGHVDVISGTVSQFYNFLANEPKEGKGICLPKD